MIIIMICYIIMIGQRRLLRRRAREAAGSRKKYDKTDNYTSLYTYIYIYIYDNDNNSY